MQDLRATLLVRLELYPFSATLITHVVGCPFVGT
jgi:hypothetical protein